MYIERKQSSTLTRVFLSLLLLSSTVGAAVMYAQTEESQDLADSYRRQIAELQADYGNVPLLTSLQSEQVGQYVQVRGHLKVNAPLVSPYFKKTCGCYSESEWDYWEEQEKITTYRKNKAYVSYRTKVHRHHNNTLSNKTMLHIESTAGTLCLDPGEQHYQLYRNEDSTAHTITAKKLRYEGSFCPVSGELMVLGHLIKRGNEWCLSERKHAQQPFKVYWGTQAAELNQLTDSKDIHQRNADEFRLWFRILMMAVSFWGILLWLSFWRITTNHSRDDS